MNVPLYVCACPAIETNCGCLCRKVSDERPSGYFCPSIRPGSIIDRQASVQRMTMKRLRQTGTTYLFELQDR